MNETNSQESLPPYLLSQIQDSMEGYTQQMLEVSHSRTKNTRKKGKLEFKEEFSKSKRKLKEPIYDITEEFKEIIVLSEDELDSEMSLSTPRKKKKRVSDGLNERGKKGDKRKGRKKDELEQGQRTLSQYLKRR